MVDGADQAGLPESGDAVIQADLLGEDHWRFPVPDDKPQRGVHHEKRKFEMGVHRIRRVGSVLPDSRADRVDPDKWRPA